jgi:hypothetical protein
MSLESIGPREISFGNPGFDDSLHRSNPSTKATRHVVFGARVSGLGKNSISPIHFNELTLMEKGRLVG